MDSKEFRIKGKELIDYIANYHDSIEKYRVTPEIKPGYLQNKVPPRAPEEPEKWDDVMKDMDKLIMPGITHWLHPNFCSFFPLGFSYASIMADALSDAVACNGFSWAASPACTELEIIVLNWLGRMMGLPEAFLFQDEAEQGGGVLQTSASDCVLVCLLAARSQTLDELAKKNPRADEYSLLSTLTAYCSKEAHSCVEKASMIGFVQLRILDTDSNFQLRGSALEDAIRRDREEGYYPFFVVGTMGTTSCASCDKLDELGPVCAKYGLWLHVDAAYGGNYCICPEFEHLLEGIENASSVNMNPAKGLPVNIDCSAMWVKRSIALKDSMTVEPLYLKHIYDAYAIDYRNWGIPLSRRFRSLKLWFTLRNYGTKHIQNIIRNQVKMAKLMEERILSDERFEVVNDVNFGLVCFRSKESNSFNEKLLTSINNSGELYMVAASLGGEYSIRYSVNYVGTTEDHINKHWKTIVEHTEKLLKAENK